MQVDRLLIYQFHHPLSLIYNITVVNQAQGWVQYEALASDRISSVLGLSEAENYFSPPNS